MTASAPDGLGALEMRYLVANTAPYLLEHFLADQYVADLARRKSTAELFETIESVDQAPVRSLSEVVSAYAAAAAIILRDDDEARRLMGGAYRANNLEWLDDFFAIARASRLSTSVATITAPPSGGIALTITTGEGASASRNVAATSETAVRLKGR